MTKTPLPQRVRTELLERMSNGALAPGARLDYKQLAKELGVSTTPVREAVAQLASEGMVDLVPRLGAVVRTLNATVAQEFYEVREAVESFAALKAAERLSPRHLVRMREQLDVMRRLAAKAKASKRQVLDGADLRLFLDTDLAFHHTILQGARNPVLARTVEETHIQSRIFFAERGSHDLLRLDMACTQHAAILSALEKRDGPAASEAMRAHIRTSLQLTLDHLEGIDQAD